MNMVVGIAACKEPAHAGKLLHRSLGGKLGLVAMDENAADNESYDRNHNKNDDDWALQALEAKAERVGGVAVGGCPGATANDVGDEEITPRHDIAAGEY